MTRASLVLPILVLLFSGCSPPAKTTGEVWTAFVGARLLDGGGGEPVKDSVLLVRNGRIEAVGRVSSVEVPGQASIIHLNGRTVIPGLINSHGHVGATQGLQMAPELYSTESVLRDLQLYSRYGVTTVLSLGDDQQPGFDIRDRQDDAGLTYSRLYLAGPVLDPVSPAEAARLVDEVAKLGADFVKIRVDDNLGRTRKMPPEIYRAVIGQAHRRQLRVAAHVYYLEDAKDLLRAGVDLLAHSVRDREVDEEFIRLLKETGVCLSPTLTREMSTFIYESTPDFFADPFFLKEADAAVLQELRDPARQERIREDPVTQAYKGALQRASQNLLKLHEAGIPLAFGTDSGPPARFQGYFEHLELELMAEAGLAPMQVLVAATSTAAACLGLDDVGKLEPGRWADFIVLASDPLVDIKNARQIESIWIAGNQVPL